MPTSHYIDIGVNGNFCVWTNKTLAKRQRIVFISIFLPSLSVYSWVLLSFYFCLFIFTTFYGTIFSCRIANSKCVYICHIHTTHRERERERGKSHTIDLLNFNTTRSFAVSCFIFVWFAFDTKYCVNSNWKKNEEAKATTESHTLFFNRILRIFFYCYSLFVLLFLIILFCWCSFQRFARYDLTWCDGGSM